MASLVDRLRVRPDHTPVYTYSDSDSESEIDFVLNKDLTAKQVEGVAKRKPVSPLIKIEKILNCEKDDENYNKYRSSFEVGGEEEINLGIEKEKILREVDDMFKQLEIASLDLAVGQRYNCCTWRVRATSIDNSGKFYVSIYIKEHSCSVTERSSRSQQATHQILGHMYKEFVSGIDATVMPNHVAPSLNKRYGIKYSVIMFIIDHFQMDYWKEHQTLKTARELVRGTEENSYDGLPTYLYRIRRTNPGTYTNLEVDANNYFKYVFIAYGASIEGFAFMRKVVVVDGTFLHGKYKGTLLIATTQDGNFTIFPVAFAVVDTENHESWEWIFRQLSIVILGDHVIAIISDSHRSIGQEITKVYPLASQGICTYHLHKNILLNLKAQILLDWLRRLWLAYKRKFAAKMKTVLTIGVEKLLEGRVEQANQLTVQEIDANEAQVTCGSSLNVVNLLLKKCTCRRFDVDKIPCVHAIATAEAEKMSQIDLAHPYYHTTYLCNGYAKSIMPCDISVPVPNNFCEKVCLPHTVRQQPQIPKKSRIKSALDVAMEKKRPQKMCTCSKCNSGGHNRLTCPLD
ncbi:uncharacterized protein LOC112089744 [Eutrema salsugineum]|uniref:uncharacterized protein LOC112089744 n=1 Tax=Eutrema salsugineum TaxID=72664 RepID=UPI000CED51F5|nr:uncharacterized protein LOC112089744 [Eutrema salsugineum]